MPIVIASKNLRPIQRSPFLAFFSPAHCHGGARCNLLSHRPQVVAVRQRMGSTSSRVSEREKARPWVMHAMGPDTASTCSSNPRWRLRHRVATAMASGQHDYYGDNTTVALGSCMRDPSPTGHPILSSGGWVAPLPIVIASETSDLFKGYVVVTIVLLVFLSPAHCHGGA